MAIRNVSILIASVMCHGFLWFITPPHDRPRVHAQSVEIEVRSPPPRPETIEPPRLAAERPHTTAHGSAAQHHADRQRHVTKPQVAVGTPNVAEATSVPVTDAPADFTDVVLTNSEGDTTFVAGGQRGDSDRPVLPQQPRPDAHSRDQSRPAQPPSLEAALATNYPAEAHARGLHGRAEVRAEIRRDGHVGAIAVVVQSGPGFGDACVSTLRDSRWQPALARDGRPIASEVSFTCTFEIRR